MDHPPDEPPDEEDEVLDRFFDVWGMNRREQNGCATIIFVCAILGFGLLIYWSFFGHK